MGCLHDARHGSGSGTVITMALNYTETGYLVSFDLEEESFGGDTLLIYKDAVMKQHGDHVYILEGPGADNILKLDPRDLSVGGVIYQQHLKDNINPTDLLIYSDDKGYVTPDNDSTIYVIDPGTGEIQKEIATSVYIYQPPVDTVPVAASPHAAAVVEWREMVYVLLQRRAGKPFVTGGTAKLLEIDPATDSITDVIDLQGINPQNMVLVGNSLYLSVIGISWGTIGAGGGIEKLDLENGTSEMVITDTDLGGNPSRIHHRSGDLFYVAVGLSDNSGTPVMLVNFATGEIVYTLDEVGDASGGVYFAGDENLVLVGDRGTPSGIRLFNEAGSQVGGPFSPGLPPAGVLVLD